MFLRVSKHITQRLEIFGKVVPRTRVSYNTYDSRKYVSSALQDKDSSVVLVTGASGYVGAWITKRLMEEGYNVRGTVRSLLNEEKVAPLRRLCPNSKYPLELVEADLTNKESWDRVVSGCDYVLHVASPFPPENPKDPQTALIEPAVGGTRNVLQACRNARVKRVVLTSSIAAITGGWGDLTNPDRVFDEKDWPDLSQMQEYEKSKALAEQAAWEFHKSIPENERFELTAVNPAYIQGPILSGSKCTSMEVCRRFLRFEMPAVPRLWLAMVDVRDVAEAHIKVLELPEADGKRHLLSAGGMWWTDIGKTINKEFRQHGYRAPTLQAPKFMVKLNGLIDGTARLIHPFIGLQQKLNLTRMRTVLGINPRPIEDAIVHMCYNLIEQGFVEKKRRYKGPPEKYA